MDKRYRHASPTWQSRAVPVVVVGVGPAGRQLAQPASRRPLGDEVVDVRQDNVGVVLICPTEDGMTMVRGSHAVECTGSRGEGLRRILDGSTSTGSGTLAGSPTRPELRPSVAALKQPSSRGAFK